MGVPYVNWRGEDVFGGVVYTHGFLSNLDGTPVTDTFFTDTALQSRRRYRYTVVAVDTTGNVRPPSPEAVAETL